MQVSNHEMVSLEREPWNAYDRNAVCVNNVRGEKVGHIKREMAKALAPIMDKNLARVEGFVAYHHVSFVIAFIVRKLTLFIEFQAIPIKN